MSTHLGRRRVLLVIRRVGLAQHPHLRIIKATINRVQSWSSGERMQQGERQRAAAHGREACGHPRPTQPPPLRTQLSAGKRLSSASKRSSPHLVPGLHAATHHTAKGIEARAVGLREQLQGGWQGSAPRRELGRLVRRSAGDGASRAPPAQQGQQNRSRSSGAVRARTATRPRHLADGDGEGNGASINYSNNSCMIKSTTRRTLQM